MLIIYCIDEIFFSNAVTLSTRAWKSLDLCNSNSLLSFSISAVNSFFYFCNPLSICCVNELTCYETSTLSAFFFISSDSKFIRIKIWLVSILSDFPELLDIPARLFFKLEMESSNNLILSEWFFFTISSKATKRF